MAASVARSYSRPDLVYLPVTDAVPVQTCVVVPEDRRERRVLDFVAVAAKTLHDEPARLAAAGTASPGAEERRPFRRLAVFAKGSCSD